MDTPEGLRRLAYGGEVLDVVFTTPVSAQHRDGLIGASMAVRCETVGPTEVRLVVNDAGEAAPAVADWATTAELTIQSIEPYLPPFDDVFVELVSRLEDDEELAPAGVG